MNATQRAQLDQLDQAHARAGDMLLALRLDAPGADTRAVLLAQQLRAMAREVDRITDSGARAAA